jgi:hypothetical protein
MVCSDSRSKVIVLSATRAGDRNRRGRFPLCDHFKSHLQPREGLMISYARSTSITGRPGRGAAPVEISAKKGSGFPNVRIGYCTIADTRRGLFA